MRYFYRFMLFMVEFELAIARTTGRDPAHIRQLTRDVDYWQRECQRLEIRCLTN